MLDIVKELRLFIFIGAKRFAVSSTSGMDFFEDLGWLNSVNWIQHEYIYEFFHYRPFYSWNEGMSRSQSLEVSYDGSALFG